MPSCRWGSCELDVPLHWCTARLQQNTPAATVESTSRQGNKSSASNPITKLLWKDSNQRNTQSAQSNSAHTFLKLLLSERGREVRSHATIWKNSWNFALLTRFNLVPRSQSSVRECRNVRSPPRLTVGDLGTRLDKIAIRSLSPQYERQSKLVILRH